MTALLKLQLPLSTDCGSAKLGALVHQSPATFARRAPESAPFPSLKPRRKIKRYRGNAGETRRGTAGQFRGSRFEIAKRLAKTPGEIG
jgi:hypothetical protein